ncbi:MAG: alanine--tRNA ligase, partial [Candidatus Omnitrophica bacterium]|nr:alanine--tRNA ligase [Candidatus Omnitrophota bacterium]
ESTGVLGLFKITLEGSVGSGIRRIEAKTGEAAYELVRKESDIINRISATLKVPPDKIIQQIERMQTTSRELEKEVRLLKLKFSNTLIDEIITKATLVEGFKVITHKLEDHDTEMLRSTLDLLKERLGSGIIVLGSGRDGRISLVAGVTNDLVKKGLNAGNIVKEVAKITGGSGGGRPDLAQAGGKYVERLDEALKAVEGIIKETVHEGNKTIK